MKVIVDKTFIKDLSKLEGKSKIQVVSFLMTINKLNSPNQIPNIKKIKGFSGLYRIRLGKYRIGVRIKDETIILIRILHRKDIYKYFPIFLI